MYRGGPARMSCVPCLQQRVRLGSADLAHYDASWLQPHTGSKTIEHGHVAHRPEVKIVVYRALQFGRVLDRYHSIVWSERRKRMQHCVHERRLSTPRAAYDKDVLPRQDCGADHFSVREASNSRCEISAITARVGGVLS